MNILVIKAADIKGGAAKVRYDLALGLRDRAHKVTYLVGKNLQTKTGYKQFRKGKLSRKQTSPSV